MCWCLTIPFISPNRFVKTKCNHLSIDYFLITCFVSMNMGIYYLLNEKKKSFGRCVKFRCITMQPYKKQILKNIMGVLGLFGTINESNQKYSIVLKAVARIFQIED